MRFAVDRLDHLVITCRDVATSASWYQRVLGMEVTEFGPHKRTALAFGGQKINLRPESASQEEWWSGVAPAPGSQDLCFIVTVAAEQVAEHLIQCGVTIAEGPVVKDGALGPIRSVYCRDPDGNLIEISSYQD
ncbi:VOC family protein [Plastoroseomonas hellenica]|uniref:VOC family protein n=1 Tax=Plastoroseomonas hellenica TaxID=2687306 RepID=A0ABS5F490_9PROT|nr:VOC family protein [Plastoroseomonas hellenica]MBR0644981.1 VOC family protein [Plastoroseomonas hellenica]MBR0667351.1 VOC family protein [Plastoroseomonas hellenica]